MKYSCNVLFVSVLYMLLPHINFVEILRDFMWKFT